MTKMINFIAGIATGAVIGMAVGSVADPMTCRQKRRIKQKSNRIFRVIGNAMDSVADMF